MSLTADQIANTTADTFDVRLRYFAANCAFTVLNDAELARFYNTTGAPIGWTVSGDNITPLAPWTEVTSSIYHTGTFVESWTEGQSTWRATISGTNYDPDSFAPGYALCCLRRILRGVYDSGWVLWWIGLLDAGAWRDDYRKGAAWQRTVRDRSAALELIDSPRLVVGVVNPLAGATVTASSTLATPGDETGNGEFIGTTATIEPENVVDGRKATVWISQSVPTLNGETPAAANRVLIDEVFFKPVAGYSAEAAWWIELYNNEATGIFRPFAVLGSDPGGSVYNNASLYTYNSDGQIAQLFFRAPAGDWNLGWMAQSYVLNPGERGVICGDRRVFEAYTGGAKNAKWVLEAKSYGTVAPNSNGEATTTYRKFDLHPTAGWIALVRGGDVLGAQQRYDVVEWGSASGLPTYIVGSPNDMWSGSPININNLTTGKSLRRSPTGTDTNTAADWTIESYPRPGDKYTPNSPEWIQIVAAPHTSTLAASLSGGASTIGIDEGTVGWPESGSGVFDDADTFTYTGRTSTTLTGCSGVGAHTKGATLAPLVAGVAMSGWYCSRLEIYRRNEVAGALDRARIYLSPYDGCGVPGETGWESDYGPPLIYQRQYGPTPPRAGDGWNQPAFMLEALAQPWVRTVLILIDRMKDSDGNATRAKINEVTARLADSVVMDGSLSSVLSTMGIWYLIRYLLANYTDTGAGGLTVSTPDLWGAPGNLALAIGPLPKILADVARTHGAVLIWNPNGGMTLSSNPWWPGGVQDTSWLYAFTAASIRGEIELSDARPPVSGIALNANGASGEPFPRVVVPPGTTGTSVREVSGYTVSSQADALALAWSEYWQASATQRATWRVKGVGEWCRPLQRYHLTWENAQAPTAENSLGQWLCEQVTYSWAPGKWECRVDTRKYFT